MNVWITGASSGIGESLAWLYASQGHQVLASARNAEKLNELAARSSDLSGKIVALPLDVTDNEAVTSHVQSAVAEFGEIDLSILNAGYYEPIEIDQLDLAHFENTYDVNLRGVIRCLMAVLPSALARRSGKVAIVSSVSGYIGLPKAAAYGSSKAALINLAESLRPECEAHGVQISLVSPGFVKSPLTDKNSFDMPFIIESDEAARRIVDGLATSKFEITFPRRFTYMLKVLQVLPYWLLFKITGKMIK
ncbi:MAG: SDR family NAD(P)-dependent oxidoreductase [Gammaproteobacteria bacterium]|nr:SDR family NAD(P)-dependent oxidoreductase [Gammaproteobacteria bacterium]